MLALTAVGTVLGSGLRAMSSAASVKQDRANECASEVLGNIRTVRAFAAEAQEVARYQERLEEAAAAAQWFGGALGLFQGSVSLALNGTALLVAYGGGSRSAHFCSAHFCSSHFCTSHFCSVPPSTISCATLSRAIFSVLWCGAACRRVCMLQSSWRTARGTCYAGAQAVASGELGAGQLTTFMVATGSMQRALAQLSVLFSGGVKASAAAGRLVEYADLEPNIERALPGRPVPTARSEAGRELRLEAVAFRYPARPDAPVLEKLSLRFAPVRQRAAATHGHAAHARPPLSLGAAVRRRATAGDRRRAR
eukprot:SAG11_NODE_983_length_6306_cov_19.831319_4_plen_309_part_00